MGGIINKQKLEKLQTQIDAFRSSIHNVRPDDLTSLAKALGRKLQVRGKHPTYVSELLKLNPISIPGHRKIKPRTAGNILDQLEADIFAFRELLDKPEQKNDQKKLPAATLHKNTHSR
jgi:hypothetical protein